MTARRLAMLALVGCSAGCGTDTAECARSLSVEAAVRATADDVEPILLRACAVGGCHLRAPGAGGLVLAPSAWPAAVVGVPAQANPAMQLVVPGQPERSWLVAKLDAAFCGATCDAAGGCGGAMPPGEPLPDVERALIIAWIRDGAR